MPVKNHKALDRRDQSSKRLIPRTYTKGSKGRREQHEWGRTEANPRETWAQTWDQKQSSKSTEHTRRRTLSKPRVANMANGRVTETQAAMKAATRWGNIDGRVDKTKFIKSWSRTRAIEFRSPKTISWKPRREGTIDGKLTTRKTTSNTTKLWPNLKRCSS